MSRNVGKIRASCRFIRNLRSARLAPVILQVASGRAVGGSWYSGDPQVEGDAGRPDPREAGKGQVNGSGWHGSRDRHGYLDGGASYYELGTANGRGTANGSDAANGSDDRPGRHPGEGARPPAPATPWAFGAAQVGETR